MAVSTMRQRKLANEIVKDLKSKGKPRNKRELMVDSGYSKSTAEASPHVIFNQEGTQKAIAVALEASGFTEENARKVVQSIMMNEAEESAVRIRAASEVFKVLGSYAAEKSFNLTATASVDELKEAVLKDMSRFKGSTKP